MIFIVKLMMTAYDSRTNIPHNDRPLFPMKSEDTNGNFKGGCLRSIINHLDYIKGLGMTGIMLTPFYKTAAYHGYHVVNFEKLTLTLVQKKM